MGIPLIASLGVLGYGLYNFLTQWKYSEDGHEYLLIGYVVLTVLIFLTLRLSKFAITGLLFVLLFCTIFYANAKFDWRKSYIVAAEGGKYFALEQYIDAYPTFEQDKFAWLLDEPRWVDFSKECYEPMLNSNNATVMNDLGRNCKTVALIQDFYKVDVRDIIRNHYSKMQNTAKQLEKGRFKNKSAFETCIQDKKCTMIPLLPAGVEVDQQSTDYLDIRRQFWSLINDKKMSVENCNFFEFCRVMTRNEVITLDKI